MATAPSISSTILETLLILLRRKFRRRLPTLELMILLELCQRPRPYMDLVDRCSASTSGMWNALAELMDANNPTGALVGSAKAKGRTVYHLLPAGRAVIAEILK